MQAQEGTRSQNRLRELREERGLRPYELCIHVQASEATISRWERGLTPIPDEAKAALAALFGVSRAYLMGWDEDEAAA